MSSETEPHPVNPDSGDYRIKLDIYNGPLDLLLYLVYKSEIDIFNIPITLILEQYLQYTELIKALDIEIAGDFLVMAGRMINIKSKLLMPRPQAEPEDEEIIDPRAELVKELIEYKENKERAYALERRQLEREKMYERMPPAESAAAAPEEQAAFFDEDTSVWDLLTAFHKITRDFMPEMPRRIVYDDTPVSAYIERLLGRLQAAPERKLDFSTLFDGMKERMQVIGMFLGVLDAVKQGAIRVHQVRDEGGIYIEYVPEQERRVPAPPEEQGRDVSSDRENEP